MDTPPNIDVRIDVYIDLICPWCLIGKRHLDAALVQCEQITPHTKAQVRWHSVQLLPDIPTQGLDFKPFYIRRLGGPEALRQRQAQVNAAAAQAGFQIDFGGISYMPNTLQAHQLSKFASARLSSAHFAQLLERLFAAHFRHGQNLGDRSTLLQIAADSGLDADAAAHWMDSGAGHPLPLDVPGVPFYVFNHTLALSGAQPVEVLLDAMQQAATITTTTTTSLN